MFACSAPNKNYFEDKSSRNFKPQASYSNESDDEYENYTRRLQRKGQLENRQSFNSQEPSISSSYLSHASEKKFKEQQLTDRFDAMFEKETSKIEERYKTFDRYPEKHPSYKEEWKHFWQRRYNELVHQKKDADSHDYKREWVDFWLPRMRQLKLNEIEDKKREIRQKLNLTLERTSKIEAKLSKEISHKFDESDDEDPRRKRQRYDSTSSQDSNSSISSEMRDDVPLTIIKVCRLLLALEVELGLLAPRVCNLLERAVALDKVKKGSSEKLLAESSTLNFLETCKEKLKGMLSANIVRASRIIAVKLTIKSIAQLVYSSKNVKPTPSQTPNEVEIAKLEIAKILAQTLIDQGRTDVSPEELSEIVEEFMKQQIQEQEAEKVKEKEITVKNVLQEGNFDTLSDDELKFLLRNYSELEKKEQEDLVKFLSALEKTDAEKVKMLSKYVDAGSGNVSD